MNFILDNSPKHKYMKNTDNTDIISPIQSFGLLFNTQDNIFVYLRPDTYTITGQRQLTIHGPPYTTRQICISEMKYFQKRTRLLKKGRRNIRKRFYHFGKMVEGNYRKGPTLIYLQRTVMTHTKADSRDAMPHTVCLPPFLKKFQRFGFIHQIPPPRA